MPCICALHPGSRPALAGVATIASMFIMLPSMKASWGKLGTLLALGAISFGCMCMPGIAWPESGPLVVAMSASAATPMPRPSEGP